VFELPAQDTRRLLQALMRQIIAPAHIRTAIEIAVAEVLNNISEHGDALDRLCGQVGPNRIEITVQDRGPALPRHLLAPQTSPDPRNWPEGGFGWPLVHALVSDLRYRRVGGINRLTLGFSWIDH
jgi:serine/threonine-protein kinase RsbW